MLIWSGDVVALKEPDQLRLLINRFPIKVCVGLAKDFLQLVLFIPTQMRHGQIRELTCNHGYSWSRIPMFWWLLTFLLVHHQTNTSKNLENRLPSNVLSTWILSRTISILDTPRAFLLRGTQVKLYTFDFNDPMASSSASPRTKLMSVTALCFHSMQLLWLSFFHFFYSILRDVFCL